MSKPQATPIEDIRIKYVFECRKGNQTEVFTLDEIENGMVANADQGYDHDGLEPTHVILERTSITLEEADRIEQEIKIK